MRAGQGSSVTEADRKSDLSLENVKTSVVSRDGEKINVSSNQLSCPDVQIESFDLIWPCQLSLCMQVRVQLPGKATQKVFDEALTFLARDAPPVPGFRKSKGGTDHHKHTATSLSLSY